MPKICTEEKTSSINGMAEIKKAALPAEEQNQQLSLHM